MFTQRGEEHLADLAVLQDALLESVSTVVRPGGVLLYTVCSVLHEEGEGRVREFLSRHEDFTLEIPNDPHVKSFTGAVMRLMT